MKIAITADHHLTTRDLNPERFETLENLLVDMRVVGAEAWIIAGDLFDASLKNYAEFDRLCRAPENRELDICVIPGNHDSTIRNRDFDAENLTILDSPSALEIGEKTFLFLPYIKGKSMGEEIVRCIDSLPAEEWVLVGHGDLIRGLRKPNPLESGVYMPLSTRDVAVYQPAHVFLGHIHAQMMDPPLYYAGSPCPLDITETGRRKYLLFNTDTDRAESRTINTPVLYFNESFVIVPVEDEGAYLRAQIDERKAIWKLKPEEAAKTVIRVRVSGYSADKAAVSQVVREGFEAFSFYKGEGPDVDGVSTSDDLERHSIAEKVKSRIENFEWRMGQEDEPTRKDILLKALYIIYGG